MVEAKIFKLYNRFIHLREIKNGSLVLFEVSSPPGIPKVTYKQYINKSRDNFKFRRYFFFFSETESSRGCQVSRKSGILTVGVLTASAWHNFSQTP